MHECKFEDKIIKLCEDTAETKESVKRLDTRINGSIDAIQDHIRHGHKWRTIIIGVGATVITNAIIFAYYYGVLTQKVLHNEAQIIKILERAYAENIKE